MRISKFVAIPLIGVLFILGACGSPVAKAPAAPAPAGGAAAVPANMPGMDMGEAPATPTAPASAVGAAAMPAHMPGMDMGGAPAMPAAPAPVAAPVQEGFTVSKLTMMESVTSGNNVTISFVVTNTAKQRGTYTANLKFNGDIVKTQDVTLDGGSSKMIEMAVITGPVGVIKVSVDQLTGKFEVMACDI